MSENTSRRVILSRGAAAIAGIATVIAAGQARAQAQEKLAQNLVQYQEGPKDGAVCSGCVNWQAPNACTIVAGVINPNGWCVAYAPKAS